MTPDPNRPYMTPKEARRFTKEYMKLNKMISNQLVMAGTMADEHAEVSENILFYRQDED